MGAQSGPSAIPRLHCTALSPRRAPLIAVQDGTIDVALSPVAVNTTGLAVIPARRRRWPSTADHILTASTRSPLWTSTASRLCFRSTTSSAGPKPRQSGRVPARNHRGRNRTRRDRDGCPSSCRSRWRGCTTGKDLTYRPITDAHLRRFRAGVPSGAADRVGRGVHRYRAGPQRPGQLVGTDPSPRQKAGLDPGEQYARAAAGKNCRGQMARKLAKRSAVGARRRGLAAGYGKPNTKMQVRQLAIEHMLVRAGRVVLASGGGVPQAIFSTQPASRPG